MRGILVVILQMALTKLPVGSKSFVILRPMKKIEQYLFKLIRSDKIVALFLYSLEANEIKY